MSVIKGLVVKDFQTIKSYKSTVLYMVVIFVVCAFLNNDMTNFLSVFMPLCFGMLGISSFSYDNLAKADRYLLTFPVSRKDMVKARYMYVMLLTLFGAVFGLVLSLVVCYVRAGAVDASAVGSIAAVAVGGAVGVMFIQAFQIPVMYKFGAEKGRIIQMVVIVAALLVASLVVAMLTQVCHVSLAELVRAVAEHAVVVLVAVVAAAYALSYVVSCRIYEKKEI